MRGLVTLGWGGRRLLSEHARTLLGWCVSLLLFFCFSLPQPVPSLSWVSELCSVSSWKCPELHCLSLLLGGLRELAGIA